MLNHVLVALVVGAASLASPVLAQTCPLPYIPTDEDGDPIPPVNDVFGGDLADVILWGADMVECCGICTGTQDFQEIADLIRDRLAEQRILWEDSLAADWYMQTKADRAAGDGSVECWNSSESDNHITLNSGNFSSTGASSDPQVGALLTGAMLAHEMVHCLTLDATKTLVNGVWGSIEPECTLFGNECFAYNLEELMINCILNCMTEQCIDPSTFTPAGIVDLQNRLGDILLEKANWCWLAGFC